MERLIYLIFFAQKYICQDENLNTHLKYHWRINPQ